MTFYLKCWYNYKTINSRITFYSMTPLHPPYLPPSPSLTYIHHYYLVTNTTMLSPLLSYYFTIIIIVTIRPDLELDYGKKLVPGLHESTRINSENF